LFVQSIPLHHKSKLGPIIRPRLHAHNFSDLSLNLVNFDKIIDKHDLTARYVLHEVTLPLSKTFVWARLCQSFIFIQWLLQT
jgi:SPX domain protein involved in polyphosphate accumulation